jgi:hypothetical protein
VKRATTHIDQARKKQNDILGSAWEEFKGTSKWQNVQAENANDPFDTLSANWEALLNGSYTLPRYLQKYVVELLRKAEIRRSRAIPEVEALFF